MSFYHEDSRKGSSLWSNYQKRETHDPYRDDYDEDDHDCQKKHPECQKKHPECSCDKKHHHPECDRQKHHHECDCHKSHHGHHSDCCFHKKHPRENHKDTCVTEVFFFTKHNRPPIVIVTQSKGCTCYSCSIIIKICGDIPCECEHLLKVGIPAKEGIICLKCCGFHLIRCA
jgi:hypothetical protein